MSGSTRIVPEGTLVDRALAYLAPGPGDSLALARDVLGIPHPPPVIAERLAVALLGADPRVSRLDDGRWMVVPAGATSPSLEACSFAVVDVETTGGRPSRGDRIVEIAVVVVRGGTIEPVFEALVNPGRGIPPFVATLTGITESAVADRPGFGDIADDLLAALGGRVFVAHNARFDWTFLSAELRRTRDRVLNGPRVCTVRLARRLIPELKSRGLDQVTQFFGIRVTRRHRAGGDALATAAVLLKLLDVAQESGARTLDDLARVTRRVPKRRSALPTQADDLWPW
ncbi:MAG: 3'-5' exonuclease [Gemmatimonadetes bacterium]|nr:3'-5' exonuclease [Gemmatimonadota bacterium]